MTTMVPGSHFNSFMNRTSQYRYCFQLPDYQLVILGQLLRLLIHRGVVIIHLTSVDYGV